MNHEILAVITNGSSRKSLSAVRSLGKAGYRVVVIDQDVFAPAAHSAFTWKFHRRKHDEALWQCLERLFDQNLSSTATSKPTIVVVPMEEECVKALSVAPNRPGVHYLVPPPNSIEIVNSKSKTAGFAASLGLRVPRFQSVTFPISNETVSSANHFLKSQRIAEWVLKPATSKGSIGILYGTGPVTTEIFVAHHLKFPTEEMILQERVPQGGAAIGVSLLFDSKSRVCGISSHRRVHEYPRSGGPSTLRETIFAPKEEAESIRLLQNLNWVGVAMVEWKVNPLTSHAEILEVNGRFWGSLELAVRAGTDFPKLYAEISLSQNQDSPFAKSPTRSIAGIRCRWLLPGDILRYVGDPQRESFFSWVRAAKVDSEEFDSSDWAGFVSTLVFMLSLAFRPRFWSLLRR